MEQKILLTCFGVPLTLYGALIALSVLVMLAVMACLCMKKGVRYAAFVRVAVPMLLCGWIMSRFVYFAANWFFSPVNPFPSFACILSFWEGGYSMMGMLLGLTGGCLIGCRAAHADRAAVTDALAVALPAGLMIARLAESQTTLGVGLAIEEGWPAVGILTDTADSGLMHAVWAYEAIIAVLLLIAMLLERCRRTAREGEGLALFTMLFGATQVLMESLRDDSHMTAHMQIHVQQIIAAILMAVPVIVWAVKSYRTGRTSAGRVTLLLIMTVAMIAAAIVAEFGVDRWGSKLLAYGIMTVCLAGICAAGIRLRTYARRNA